MNVARRFYFHQGEPAWASIALFDRREPIGGEGFKPEVRHVREDPVMAPAKRDRELSLPLRAWIAVGAAAALWGIAALVFALLS